jgi:predicted nucleic acid-binding protein
MAHYIDTSALAKLVVAEPETAALLAWIREAERDLVTCDLSRTELMRAVRRVDEDRAPDARAVLDTVTITKITTALTETAGRLDPLGLRSLDAIHLAAALDLQDDLDGMVVYDARLGEAARANGVRVIAPT